MMQRKNKPKQQSSSGGYGSGYEGSNTTADSLNNSGHIRNKSDADSGLNSTSSSPSKQSKPSPHNAPSSTSGISIAALTGHKATPANTSQVKGHVKSKVSIATVKRSKCGTQPFDVHWLNVDCCGLICAFFTYCLHAYGIYAFCWVLLPPWFSVMDEDGYREVSY